MKICSVGAKLFHVDSDRQDKDNRYLSQFCVHI